MDKIEQEYKEILASGMFFVFFPEMCGNWSKDQEDFTEFFNKREAWLLDQTQCLRDKGIE